MAKGVFSRAVSEAAQMARAEAKTGEDYKLFS